METEQSAGVDRLVGWADAPPAQLGVVTSGLIVVAGGPAWQVTWLFVFLGAALLRLFVRAVDRRERT